MSDSFFGFFHTHTSWLYTKIYENSLFFFDYWSLVHLWSGITLILLLTAFRLRRKWLLLFTILLLYEVLEIAFLYFALDIFRPETFKDQGTDIVIGLLGGAVGYLMTSRRKLQIIFSSFTLAFVWVGNYQYHYNIPSLNTPGLNLWAFSLWWIGGCLIIELFLFIRNRIESRTLQLLTFWLSYVTLLLFIEYIGYNLLNISEMSYSRNSYLIFGLIHGNFWLHLYYLVAPFLIIMFYTIVDKLVSLGKMNENQVAKA